MINGIKLHLLTSNNHAYLPRPGFLKSFLNATGICNRKPTLLLHDWQCKNSNKKDMQKKRFKNLILKHKKTKLYPTCTKTKTINILVHINVENLQKRLVHMLFVWNTVFKAFLYEMQLGRLRAVLPKPSCDMKEQSHTIRQTGKASATSTATLSTAKVATAGTIGAYNIQRQLTAKEEPLFPFPWSAHMLSCSGFLSFMYVVATLSLSLRWMS